MGRSHEVRTFVVVFPLDAMDGSLCVLPVQKDDGDCDRDKGIPRSVEQENREYGQEQNCHNATSGKPLATTQESHKSRFAACRGTISSLPHLNHDEFDE
jgi:hypothetical protein